MTDPVLAGLLAVVADGDLNALLMLADWLEERGDPRADTIRHRYDRLNDDAVYAPLAFRQFDIAGREILPLFPEYEAGDP